MTFKLLDARTFVSPQITLDDIAAVSAAGVTTLVNNRPDDEEPGQPAGDDIEAAAAAAGLDYRHIPVGSGFSANQVQAMAATMERSAGPILAFCRSGTRSTFLWALARAEQGEASETLMRKAAAAGYDLSPIRIFLDR